MSKEYCMLMKRDFSRTKLTDNMSGTNIIEAMIEDNMGAQRAIMDMISRLGVDNSLHVLSHLADMNIRGTQLAYVFQEVCERSIETLVEKTSRRDASMVNTVNSFFRGDIPYKAVERGALTAAELPTFDSP